MWDLLLCSQLPHREIRIIQEPNTSIHDRRILPVCSCTVLIPPKLQLQNTWDSESCPCKVWLVSLTEFWEGPLSCRPCMCLWYWTSGSVLVGVCIHTFSFPGSGFFLSCIKKRACQLRHVFPRKHGHSLCQEISSQYYLSSLSFLPRDAISLSHLEGSEFSGCVSLTSTAGCHSICSLLSLCCSFPDNPIAELALASLKMGLDPGQKSRASSWWESKWESRRSLQENVSGCFANA